MKNSFFQIPRYKIIAIRIMSLHLIFCTVSCILSHCVHGKVTPSHLTSIHC